MLYVTTPIYYVNDSPHIGHAYTNIVCDIIARFHRQDNKEVKFLTGTDEHGQKVEKSAIKRSIAPQEFTDKISINFSNLAHLLHISNDDFIRTTQDRHKTSATKLWEMIYNSGYIYKDYYEGWYSIRDESFYQESDLVNGKAPNGSDVEWVKEESYFFRLSQFQDELLEFYHNNKDFIYPQAKYNEVISFVKSGLKDLSISRTSFKWGIPVPDNDKHTMYVWLDALSNYLTGVNFPDCNSNCFKQYWENGKKIHVIGKDILRFHAVYWPAFLIAAKLPLPTKILAHGWWTNNGEKISKSIGNVIDPVTLINDFSDIPQDLSVDYLRYFLMREIKFGNDGDFSKSKLITRVNTELANNIGNLIHRTTSMVKRNCNNQVPELKGCEVDEILITTEELALECIQNIKLYKFSEALESILNISSTANEYIDKQSPWKLKKSNPQQMNRVLYNLLEMVRYIGLLLIPFIPTSAEKILNQLSIPKDQRSTKNATHKNSLTAGSTILDPEVIFHKIEQ